MFDLHRIIAREGIEEARRMAVTKCQRASIQAAAAVLRQKDNPRDLAFASVFVTALPHRRAAGEAVPSTWRHEGRTTTVWLSCDAGEALPSGAKARSILMFLQSEAVRQAAPLVDLGPSTHAWLQAMGVHPIGGMSYRVIAEQLRRMAGCRVRVAWKDGAQAIEGPLVEGVVRKGPNGRIEEVSGAVFAAELESGAIAMESAFPLRVRLGAPVFESLATRAVAVRRTALSLLGDNAAAVDLYILLAQRLPALRQPTAAPWFDLGVRFGKSYKRLSHLKPRYLDALRLALAVYPEAEVQVTGDGLILFPSPPPIASGQPPAAKFQVLHA